MTDSQSAGPDDAAETAPTTDNQQQPARKSAREWGAERRTPEWLLRAAETVARITGRDLSALTADDFDAAVSRER